MPFQVIFSISQKQAGVIQSFTAGEDQFAICDPDTTLTATVIGDLTGHTVFWEQIDGSTVTFTTPQDQLEVSYTATIADDKTFRFYIDKDTTQEQSDDIIVFGTPTVQAATGLPDRIDNSPKFTFTETGNTDINCRRPVLSLLRGFSLTGDASDCPGTNDNLVLRWTDPCLEDRLDQYVVEERTTTGGAWSQVAIVPTTNDQNFTNINVGSVYRVSAVATDRNSASFAIRSNEVFIDPNPDVVGIPAIFAASPVRISNDGNNIDAVKLPSYVATLLTKKEDSETDDAFISSSAGNSNHLLIPTYTILSGAQVGG